MTRMELFSGRNEEVQESGCCAMQESGRYGDSVTVEGDEGDNELGPNGGFVVGVEL